MHVHYEGLLLPTQSLRSHEEHKLFMQEFRFGNTTSGLIPQVSIQPPLEGNQSRAIARVEAPSRICRRSVQFQRAASAVCNPAGRVRRVRHRSREYRPIGVAAISTRARSWECRFCSCDVGTAVAVLSSLAHAPAWWLPFLEPADDFRPFVLTGAGVLLAISLALNDGALVPITASVFLATLLLFLLTFLVAASRRKDDLLLVRV
jgi:hypothetical protein